MFSFFFITCLITSMISCINFNGKIMIFKPNIRFSGLITFLLRKIFSLGNFFFIFSAIDVSSRRSIGLGNLQRFITSRVSFLILKTPSSPLKNALYICFFSSVMSFVFLSQYFLILFNTTSAIFECPNCISTLLIFCHDSFIFSSLL